MLGLLAQTPRHIPAEGGSSQPLSWVWCASRRVAVSSTRWDAEFAGSGEGRREGGWLKEAGAGSGCSRQPLSPSAFTPGGSEGLCPVQAHPKSTWIPSWVKVSRTRSHPGHLGPKSPVPSPVPKDGLRAPRVAPRGSRGHGDGVSPSKPTQTLVQMQLEKNRKRFPSAAHGAGGAAGTSPPLAGLLRKEPCQSSSSQIPSRRCSPVNSGCILPV